MANVKVKSKKKDGDKSWQYCRNFKFKEFACNDGTDKILIDKDMVYVLQYAREYFKKAIIINSAYRTPSYNTSIGGASQSYHIYGRAFDVDGVVSLTKLTSLFNTLGVKGIILYKSSNFVHIDSREIKYHADNNGNYKTFSKCEIPLLLLFKYTKGIEVAIVKFKLKSLGYYKGNVDGVYDVKLKSAVKKFQKENGLEVNGHIDKKTHKKLF